MKEKDPDDLYNVLLDALTGKIDVTVTTILVIPDLSLSLLRNSILVTKVENCCTCNGRPTTDRWPFKGIFWVASFLLLSDVANLHFYLARSFAKRIDRKTKIRKEKAG